MKKLLGGVALATVSVSALLATIALRNGNIIKQVKADLDTYYLIGDRNGWNTSTTSTDPIASGDYQGYLTTIAIQPGQTISNVSLKAGENFKFVAKQSYDYQRNSGNLQYTSLLNTMLGGGNGNNIEIYAGGAYDIKMSSDSNQITILPTGHDVVSADVYVQLYDGNPTYVYAFQDFSDNYAYTAGGKVVIEPDGAWEQVLAVSNYTAHSFFKEYNSANSETYSYGGIGKQTITYLSGSQPTYLILNNRNGSQSGDQELKDGYFYWNSNSSTAGSANAGLAAKAIYDIDKAISEASGTCNIGKDRAAELLSEIPTGEVKTQYFDHSVWTYDKEYPYSNVEETLTRLSNGSGAATIPTLSTTSNETNYTLVIASAVVISVFAAAAGLIYARTRRKAE